MAEPIETESHDDDIPEIPDNIKEALYTYRARPDPDSRYDYGVYDGDTFQLTLDQGFRTNRAESLRAWHTDTAEIQHAHSQEEREMAYEQRDYARQWIADAIERHDGDWPLLVRSGKAQGKYGRWLAMIFDWDGNSLEADMIDEFGTDYLAEDYSREDLKERFTELSETL